VRVCGVCVCVCFVYVCIGYEDTTYSFASEIGEAYGKTTYLITTLRKVLLIYKYVCVYWRLECCFFLCD